MWPFPKKKGTAPDNFVPIMLEPGYPQVLYQVHQTYPWPPAPAHEQRSALVNCWQGNQMPGYTNFISSVPQSAFTWNVPTSYANYLVNKQYNVGMNTGGMSAWNTSLMQLQAFQAWSNKAGFSNVG